MTAIYGLFDKPDQAQRAYTGLKRAGIASRDITVVSGEPFEAFEFSHRDHSMILFRLSAIGGVIGFVSAVALVVGTEVAWPIVTGGMPIVAWWPNLVIIFEMTFLGAILTNVISLLVTAKLPRFRRPLYDTAVADGKILVGAPAAAGTEAAIRDALGHSGASAVKRVDL
ncbi:MAG TPA: quinol:electron acceptor oxidoreductase subunit ActD [Vicinamibacterales bacterium]|nr:quinol:electron acceptor oxidoreductase subunit ActD [Vicinamibacterales bacterium]